MFNFAVAASARRSFPAIHHPQNRTCRSGFRAVLSLSLLLACSWASSAVLAAQSASNAQTPATQDSAKPKASAAPQVLLPRVTTTVQVHDTIKDDYLPVTVTVGSLTGETLQELPASATVVTRELLFDQGARLLSDVVKNDASIGEDYAPVGYYGDYEIRGFTIDLATGLQINGMSIAGEQDVPLENKESVEFLKGIAGIESGVASAGGLINFETKRPMFVKAADLATDHRGSSFGAFDLGQLFGSRKQVGARINLAGEKIQSYVNEADGWRAMGAGAADWKISQKAILKGDFEYQHKLERSVCGYQLLDPLPGSTTMQLPDLSRIYPSTMLGEQSWAKPNTFDTFNTSTRLDYDLPHAWKAFAAASFSHSLIDDNVVYAYGNSVAGADYFFSPYGDYDIYDYRNPGELRINAQAEAMAVGTVKTGVVTHDLAVGGVIFLRSVQMPGFDTVAHPTSLDGVVQDGAVYTWVGSDNIYQPIAPVDLSAAEDPHQSAGPRRLYEDNHQAALIVQDRMQLPGRIQLIAGGREDSLRDHNYSPYATCSNFFLTPSPCAPIYNDKMVWLPQYAATYNPIGSLRLYGNYSVMLSLGPQAPWWADNANIYLSPFNTRQAEVGAKYELNRRMLVSAALFHMRAPFFYPESDGSGGFNFVSQGRETHNGIELNAEGKATSWMRLTASATALNAKSDNTGTPTDDNKQILNAPHLHTNLFADLLVPHAHNLHLMPGWSYTGRKEATRDDTVSVPGYNLFNLGARYTPGGEQGHVTMRIYADNILDKRYWKDTGASYGDTFIHLGAPTTVRLSAHYTF
jgi:iron complex outermembrane receptor protein